MHTCSLPFSRLSFTPKNHVFWPASEGKNQEHFVQTATLSSTATQKQVSGLSEVMCELLVPHCVNWLLLLLVFCFGTESLGGIYTLVTEIKTLHLSFFPCRGVCVAKKTPKKQTKKRTVVTCRSKIISLLIKMYQKWIDTLLKLEFAHIKHSGPLFFSTFLWWLGKNSKTFEKERYKHTFILTVQKRRTVTI